MAPAGLLACLPAFWPAGLLACLPCLTDRLTAFALLVPLGIHTVPLPLTHPAHMKELVLDFNRLPELTVLLKN